MAHENVRKHIAKLLLKVIIAAAVCVAGAVCVQAQNPQQSGGDESWTKTSGECAAVRQFFADYGKPHQVRQSDG